MLLEAPILPTLLRLSAPNVLNLAAIAGLITFDGLFLGRLGPDALAGVSRVPFVMFMQHVAASGMGGAVSSAIARALGAGARQRANELASHAFALALGMALVFSVVMLTAGPVMYRWMGGRGAVLEAALDYSAAVGAAALSLCMLNILANVVRGAGDMGLPRGGAGGSVLAHVAVSPLLIFGWGPVPALGPAGAGWGLAGSFGVGSVVLFLHLRGANSLVKLDLGRLPASRRPVPGVLPRRHSRSDQRRDKQPHRDRADRRRRTPRTGSGHRLRDGRPPEYIMIPLAFGFGTALVALVGTNWGAGQQGRARTIAWTGAGTVAAACGAVGLLFAFCRSSGWGYSPAKTR